MTYTMGTLEKGECLKCIPHTIGCLGLILPHSYFTQWVFLKNGVTHSYPTLWDCWEGKVSHLHIPQLGLSKDNQCPKLCITHIGMSEKCHTFRNHPLGCLREYSLLIQPTMRCHIVLEWSFIPLSTLFNIKQQHLTCPCFSCVPPVLG